MLSKQLIFARIVFISSLQGINRPNKLKSILLNFRNIFN